MRLYARELFEARLKKEADYLRGKFPDQTDTTETALRTIHGILDAFLLGSEPKPTHSHKRGTP